MLHLCPERVFDATTTVAIELTATGTSSAGIDRRWVTASASSHVQHQAAAVLPMPQNSGTRRAHDGARRYDRASHAQRDDDALQNRIVSLNAVRGETPTPSPSARSMPRDLEPCGGRPVLWRPFVWHQDRSATSGASHPHRRRVERRDASARRKMFAEGKEGLRVAVTRRKSGDDDLLPATSATQLGRVQVALAACAGCSPSPAPAPCVRCRTPPSLSRHAEQKWKLVVVRRAIHFLGEHLTRRPEIVALHRRHAG